MRISSRRRRVVAAAIAVAALVALSVVSEATAAGPYPGISDVRAAKKGKLSPRLLALSRAPLSDASANAQAAALDLARSGPGSLLRNGRSVLVYVTVQSTSDAAVGALRAAGLDPTHVSSRYRVVTGLVPPASLTALAAVPFVLSVSEAIAPMTSRSGASASVKASLAGSFTSCGSKTSEGVRQLSADSARSAFAVDGTGIKVGVLSDSYDADATAPTHAANDVASGDLPGPGNPCSRTTAVSVVDEINNPADATDEGRAMAQIVHDVAPGASISFATAFDGFYTFADNITALRAGGAKVIVDDVTYFDEPMFQEGPIDVSVSNVVADGALYFSSAGNSNVRLGGNNVGSYEAPAYRPTTCPTNIANQGYLDCHDFIPGAGTDNGDNIVVSPGGGFYLTFQWAEPWYGVSTDLDAYVIDSGTGALLASSIDDQQTGTDQTPSEFLSWGNSSGSPRDVSIVLARWSGTATPRVKFIIPGSGGITSIQYNASSGGDVVGPSIWAHNGSPDAFSVAAVPYNDRTSTESFSSRGPRTLYFGPVLNTTPASTLGSPEVVPVPHIAATDGGANTFFGSLVSGTWRFYGTSAAAPHAAAVAALMAERKGSLTRSEALSAFQATSHPVANNGGANGVGAGLVDALGAVDKVVPTGFLRVTTSPAVPSQILVDGKVMDNWGLQWVKVPAGAHTVSFTDVQGYVTPADANVNVTAGNTTEVVGTFVQQGLLRVLTSPALPGTITVDGIRRNDWGLWTYFPVGAHQVCFAAVADYLPPSCQNLNLAAGTGNADVTGVYAPSLGAPGEGGSLGELRVTSSPALPTQISVDGDIADNWGLTWLKLAAGAHTVRFTDVEGYTTPADQAVNVTSGATTTIAGTFVQRGLLRVMTSPSVPGNGATIFVSGSPRDDYGAWTWFPTGSYEVCYGYIPGFVPPPCVTVSLTAGNQTTVTGTYTPDS